MGKLNNIFKRLNVMEQLQLNQYINTEVNKKMLAATDELEKLATEKEKMLSNMNDRTWQRIETFLHIAMREHKISEERINKIDTRVKELSDEVNGEKFLLGEEQKSEYKIMHSDDFSKMIELLMDSNCKNCHSRNSKCEVYGLLKKYNIPHAPDRGKCKYAYFRIGKKVV